MIKDGCVLCGKKSFDGLVCYSDRHKSRLCKGCYLRWRQSRECVFLERLFEKTKSGTRRWDEMCRKQVEIFRIWLRRTQREVLSSSSKEHGILEEMRQICVCGHKRKSHMYNGCCVHKDEDGKMCPCKEFIIRTGGLM